MRGSFMLAIGADPMQFHGRSFESETFVARPIAERARYGRLDKLSDRAARVADRKRGRGSSTGAVAGREGIERLKLVRQTGLDQTI